MKSVEKCEDRRMAKWESLIAARGQLHLSQLEAAERVNVGLVTYQRWEAGKSKPQPQHMRHLYDVFGTMLDGSEVIPSQGVPTHECVSETSPTTSVIGDPAEELPIVVPGQEVDEPVAYVEANMTTHLWSLAFRNYPTCNDMHGSIRQAIKEFDIMNTTNKNYQITRRDALCALVTLPVMTLGLTTAGKTVQPTQYASALAHCRASLDACCELAQIGDASSVTLAFKSASKYQSILETIARNASQYRQEALDLAARYALVKTLYGWFCAGPTATIQYARDAIALSKETGNISLQLSAYSKLAWAYFYDKKYPLAENTAQQAEALLQQYSRTPDAPPLHPCVQGGTYSTLALMQAINRHAPDLAVGKATEIDPGNEWYAFMTFDRSNLLFEVGLTYCYQGKQAMAMKWLEKRVDPETLSPNMPLSEWGRVETINTMALSSVKAKDRDMERAIHLWTAGMEGARALQSEQAFIDAVTTYELMEVAWPGEARIEALRDHIVHWE